MNQINYKVEIIGKLERDRLSLNNERDKLLSGIQELNNSKSGIDTKITMIEEQLNREYMDLKELFLKDK